MVTVEKIQAKINRELEENPVPFGIDAIERAWHLGFIDALNILKEWIEDGGS